MTAYNYYTTRIIVALMLVFSFGRASNIILEQDTLDISALIERIAKPYDFDRTIHTLIEIESVNGHYPVNLQDPSCGITHINIDTYIKRHKLKDTPFNRNKACSDLLMSPEWAILNALEELVFWKKIHCKSDKCTKLEYENIIKSYNAGWNYKSVKAKNYYKKFQATYRKLYGSK